MHLAPRFSPPLARAGACYPARSRYPGGVSRVPVVRLLVRRASEAPLPVSPAGEEDDFALQRLLGGPRIEAGLDVHRRVHLLAGKHPGYLFQWRAFCERQRREWQDAHGAYDEDVLAGTAASRRGAVGTHSSQRPQSSITSWSARSCASRRTRLLAGSRTGRSAGERKRLELLCTADNEPPACTPRRGCPRSAPPCAPRARPQLVAHGCSNTHSESVCSAVCSAHHTPVHPPPHDRRLTRPCSCSAPVSSACAAYADSSAFAASASQSCTAAAPQPAARAQAPGSRP